MFMTKIKDIASTLYNSFLINRHRFVRFLLYGILLLSLVIGAGYRAIDIKENFSINGGFEHYVNMASHFWTDPGGYNFEYGLKMKEDPDNYIFTRHPKEPATASFENEKGWEFILSLIFKEGTKGIQNLAMTVVRYQVMLDILVIILLFWAGKSIAGPLGGSFAAILYAVFKPSISMVSWVSYYYWAIPFSALSLVFWTAIYKPEKRIYPLGYAAILFFLYGIVMGFAVSIRLAFLFLPLFLSPLIFFRERALKRSLVLLVAMLIGQSVLLAPQVLITYKYYDKFTLSTRGKWHHVISGLAIYPNPFGIRDSGDLTAVNWAIERGGPDLNKEGIQEYDRFMKKEALLLIKERPDIFLRNFKRNLYAGITLTPHGRVRYIGGPGFYGIIDSDKDVYLPEILKFAYLFPWLALLSIFIISIFWREKFGPLISVVFQGFYILAILCIYFLPVDVHSTAYFPVFVLLLAVTAAIFARGILAFSEGWLRCWVKGKGIKEWPVFVKECFREDWDTEYRPTITDSSEPFTSFAKKWLKQYPMVKWLTISAIVLLLIAVLFIVKTGKRKHMINERSDNQTIQMINSILNSDTNGNFESWINGESAPPNEWNFAQLFGKGGEIHMATGSDKVLSGTSSAEVRADTSADSQLFFIVTPDKLYSLIGKTISVEGWVKSSNNAANKIYISIYNGIDSSRYPKAYYRNSGEWENLTLLYKVPDDITSMLIVLNVEGGADASAYFDKIAIRYDPKYDDEGILPIVRTVEEEELYQSGLLSLKRGDYFATISALERLEKLAPNSILTLTLRQNINTVRNSFNIIKHALTDAYVIWNMDDEELNRIDDAKGRFHATAFGTGIASGHSEKSRYFNGKDSYIKTPVSFKGWKDVTISLWVKPERKEGNELSVILDNGHDAKTNFAIQSTDNSGTKWVWHCNGIDITFRLPLNKWTQVVVVASGDKGIVQAYANGLKIAEARSYKFEFGSSLLTIGKLANADERYFKGSIDEVIILNKAIVE